MTWHGDPVKPDATAWLVKGLLPARGVGLLAGQWGAGKTFLALDLAVSVAAGVDFFGRRVASRGGVLFLAAEALDDIPARVDAAAGKAMLALAGTGDPARLPIAWDGAEGLNSESGLASGVSLVRGVGEAMRERFGLPLALVIVDTLAAAFSFNDENDAAEATKAMKALAKLSAASGALVLATAHYGKSAETGVRGSSAFSASADVILAAECDKDGSGKVASRHLGLTKSKRAAAGWRQPFRLVPVAIGEDADGEPVESCRVEVVEGAAVHHKPGGHFSTDQRLLVEALETKLCDEGRRIRPFPDGPEVIAVPSERVRAEFYARKPADSDTARASEAKRKAYRRAIDRLVDAKRVVVRVLDGVEFMWSLRPAREGASHG